MKTLRHEFVEYIPAQLEDGVIYISMFCRLGVHKCVCGCGHKVITPFSPTDWELRFNGEYVSLDPSIGNWNFECRSHYWLINNEVKHAGNWSNSQVEKGREKDRQRKADFYANDALKLEVAVTSALQKKPKSRFKRLKSLLNFLHIN